MSDISFVVLLFVCLCSGVVLTILHFQMKLRLEAARLPVKWFMAFSGDLRMWKMYRNEAPRRQWPVWPFFAYRILLVVFALTAIPVVLNGDRVNRLVSFPLVLARLDWIVAWIYVVSLAVAVVFTVRLISKLPRSEGKPLWGALRKDEYRRSDLYAAILGWSGIPLTYFVARFLNHTASH